MTWSVIYRPEQRHFTFPLSRAFLNDPAFSPDPRAHPHFPLANAASYKALPPKCSPTYNSDAQSDSSPNSVSPRPTQPKVPSKQHPRRYSSLPLPEILPKPDNTNTQPKPVPQNARIPRKGKMKALVRRFTSRHNLDRIDELDETDPSGVGYHHDGPYEAIGSLNLAQSPLPQRSSHTLPRGGNIHHSKHKLYPHPLRPSQHRSAFSVPSAHSETGLSLNLEPGQILQQNTVYSSHTPIASAPRPSQPNTNTILHVTRSDHSRSSSSPNIQMRPPDDPSSLDFLDGFQNRSPSTHSSREHYFRDNTLDILNTLPPHRDRDAAPYVPCQAEMTAFPPPRYESTFRSSGSPRSSQPVPQPFSDSRSWNTQSDSAVSALSNHPPRHKSALSVNSSHKPNGIFTQPTSSLHNTSLEPLRLRHLPKRLVMPSPLQPQPSQVQPKLLPTEAAPRQDGYSEDQTLEGAHFSVPPALHAQNPRHIRRRLSAFPAKTPIPDHAPMSQDDAVPIMGDSPAKAMNETERTKERTRQRKLSKRKNDI